MPRGRYPKSGILETMIQKEVSRAVKQAVKSEDLATSSEIKKLLKEIKNLKKGGKTAASSAAPKKNAAKKTKRLGRKPSHKTCTVAGCTKPHYAKGLCASHYQKSRREAVEGAKTGKKKPGRKPGRKPAAKTASKTATKKTTAKRGRKKKS